MQGDLCDVTLSGHIISLNDVGGIKNIFYRDVYNGEQFSFPTNLASCFSEQMDVPEVVAIS